MYFRSFRERYLCDLREGIPGCVRVGKILEHPNQQRPAGEPAPVKAETSELQPGAQGTGTRGTGSLHLSGVLDCRQNGRGAWPGGSQLPSPESSLVQI